MRVHLRGLLIALLLILVAAACRGEDAKTPGDEGQRKEKSARTPDSEPEPREVFGLPLPPDYSDRLEISETLVTVHTSMTVAELSAFFRSRLVDYEYVEMSGRVRVLPLRPHSPSLEFYTLAGRHGQLVIDYHAAPDVAARELARSQSLEAIAEKDGDLARALEHARNNPTTNRGERAPWLSAMRGKPVELRTSDGELLAPGAVWGEPYTPPPGSPLYGEQNRENFGRPFGDWRMH
ncbi:hypothetical protein DV096_09815 [Bradymonadaceae bacterium TMQ3]|uniref:Uncharacterized protein n=1 Tax=Lujinxingia sediminis TaxID=2480984 RepID=A0ABY0CPG3_9DELT|nr:hypothetical protein [Lujinxingia sediminis]RDV38101.1 hypothetical protein DV096_09815 [Bradymonadaceae bacterium TMQ3]RVU42229.1 hypothetical protein EA187_16715 [Lujinxingia sediminis]TXC75773.1 hypothetical protein FRC91_09725 [Bradymonadales bacterium TMQ1]